MPSISAFRITPDGHLVLDSQALTLDEFTHTLPPGYYTTFRTYHNRTHVLGLQTHLERLYQPAATRGIKPVVVGTLLQERLAGILRELDGDGEKRVRLILTELGDIYVGLSTLVQLPEEIYQNGVQAKTVDIQRHNPHLKSTIFISESQETRNQIKRESVFEGLLVKSNIILEGVTSNFFYVSENMLGTAQDEILHGVTRKVVLAVAKLEGIEIKFEPLKINSFASITEAFLTSSSRGLVPIVQIDGMLVGNGKPGPVTNILMRAYRNYVLENAELI